MTTNAITLQIGGSLELVIRPPEEIQTIITVRYRELEFTIRGNGMAYVMPVDHYIEVKVSYVDSHGNPARIDGEVVWASSNGTVATVAVDGIDSSQATVSAAGMTGSAQITATADADLGTGVRELITLLDVSVVAGEAVAGTIEVTSPPVPV